ncbi:MAG: type II toxin-antitoxin system PemK/MazF family toxin [Gemmatimonadetes bacterium]|nr:type II toxin-antitoxin system PemK/MazF family toxin [Gemmatimonadota bacterium]
MSPPPRPSRGEIWLVDLDPTKGREQRGTRPALVVSTDKFNHGPAELVIVLPVTTVSKDIPSHVAIARTDSGLDHDSYVICEQVRCVSRERLSRQIGLAPLQAMQRVSVLLRVLLEL